MDQDALPGVDNQLLADESGLADAYARRLVATRTYRDPKTGEAHRMDLADIRDEVAAALDTEVRQ